MKTEELEIKYIVYNAEKDEKVTAEFVINDKLKIAKCMKILNECWVESALELLED